MTWLAQEMTIWEGAFCASLDADSEGEEGKFYVWSMAEIVAALGEDDAAFFAQHYDVTEGGNFEGHTILNRLQRQERSAADEARLARLRGKLLGARSTRVRPGLDDKILADWNGEMIAALVHAGTAFGEASWLDRARRAFEFIASDMTKGDRLGHSWRAGRLLYPGLASDFAQMIRAALALYEATGQGDYLDRALAWQRAFDQHYSNPANGGYFLTADDAEGLVVRPSSTSDDATPNPNGIAAQNLIRLAALTGDHVWREKADKLIAGVLAAAQDNLFAHASLLNALDLRLNAAEIVVTGADSPALCGRGAEAAASQPHRAARAFGRCITSVASGPGQDCGRLRQRGVRLRRRALLAAGHRSRRNRRSGRSDASSRYFCLSMTFLTCLRPPKHDAKMTARDRAPRRRKTATTGGMKACCQHSTNGTKMRAARWFGPFQFDFGRLGVLAWCFLKGAHMVKNPEQQAALFARREKQKIEGAIAMNEYLANEAATRRKTKRLRELRLAKEASEAREGAE